MINLDQITVIVPTLPPAIDGVGDYGLNLDEQMRQDFSVITELLIGDANWSGQDFIEGFPVKQVGNQSQTDLLESFSLESLLYDQN
ncbi:hypothetical protein [Trichormus azollae]|jgi:hypothetical protein|uniref:hypothetical protein n=1 Tax=Trichormus azollae TaxID=1164 RepID=UPI0001956DD6|nr:hypothetical protein [Trichormus azollae]